jgi:hypothetical protein
MQRKACVFVFDLSLSCGCSHPPSLH